MTDSTRFQASFKSGAGYDATLLNVYSDNIEEFKQDLADFIEAIPTILVAQQQLHAGGTVADAVPLATEQPVQPSAAPPQVVQYPSAAPASAPPAAGGVEVISDRYGNRWTYGLPDAPLLTDGRGNYARKDWTSQKGAALKAWVDPAKGPKPFQKGSVEAEIVWIR